MRAFLRQLFTEGADNPSVGSVCVFVVLMVYAACMCYAQYTGKGIVISAVEAGALAGVIYGLKKIPPAVKKDKDAPPQP